MPLIIYTDALIIGVYILSLLWATTTVAILLERKRQSKLPHYVSLIKIPLPARRKSSTVSRSPTHPLHYKAIIKSPRRSSAADTQTRTVIHIEPDGTPTQEQRNIQRLINHIQKIAS